MTLQPLTVALPPGRIFSDGDVISLAAVDPTTGAEVGGVVLANIVLEIELLSGGDASSGVFTVVAPVLIPQK